MHPTRTLGMSLVLLLVSALSTHATPVLVVAGELSDASGNRVPGTLTVTATNETRGIQVSADSHEGTYTITLVAWPPDTTTAAEIGDQLRIIVTDQSDQQVAVAEHQLTATDVENAVVEVPLSVQPPVAPIPALVVSGTVNDESDTPVGAGWNVEVANELRQLSVSGVTDALGKYALALVSVEVNGIAAQMGDVIVVRVQDATGQRQTEQRHTLNTANLQNAQVSVPVTVSTVPNTPPQFVRIGEQDASPAGNLSFEAREGQELRLQLVVEDSDGDVLQYAASPMPVGARFEGNTFLWTPRHDTVTRLESSKPTETTLIVSDGRTEARQVLRIMVSHVPNAATVQVTVAETLTAIPGISTPITITVQDTQGKPVTDVLVTLSRTPNVGTLSDVTAQGDGTFTATYTAGTTLGKVTIAAVTDNQKQGQASVELVPGPPAKLDLQLDPAELLAGSGDTANIIVAALDAADHRVRDVTVTLSSSPDLGTLTSPQEQTDGTYRSTYTAGETPGIVTFTAQSGELTTTEQLTLTEKLEPSASRSQVQVNSPVNVGQTAIIQIKVLSGSGVPMAGISTRIIIEDADKTLEPSPTDVQGQTQATVQFTRAGSYRVRVNLLPDGAILDAAPLLVVTPGSPSRLVLEAPSTVERGNSITLNLSAQDRYTNPVSDAEIQVHTTLGKVTSPAISRGEGSYTATFLSEVLGDATITASIAGGPDDEVSLQIVDTLAVIHSATVEPLQARAGDALTVTATAEVGGKTMAFSIEGVASAQERPMVETSPGVYEGTYRVLSGENVTDAAVVIQFTDASDNRREFTLVDMLVTIDTTLPPAPENFHVQEGGITAENMAQVAVRASATPGRKVWLAVEGGDTFSSVADADGSVVWALDASEWPNGDYDLEAYEEPDEVGNAGLKAHAVVTKDDRPLTAILFVQIVPTPIPYNSEGTLEVSIGFTTQPPESVDLEITLHPPQGETHVYVLDRLRPDTPGTVNFPADAVGQWSFQVYWKGNGNHRATEREGMFEVTTAQGDLSLEASVQSVKQGNPVSLRGQLTPPLVDQPIRVQGLGPGVQAWQQLPGIFTTSTSGRFEVTVTPDMSGVWQYRATWDGLTDTDGNQLYVRTFSRPVEVTAGYPTGKVVIAVGGDVNQSHWEKTFFRLGREVHDAFLDRGFPEESIRFLSPITKSPTDTPLNEDELESAILEWGTQGLLDEENLYVYLLSDSEETDGFILQRGILGTERLEQSAVDKWLETLNKREINVVFFMESCYSGQYLHPAQNPPKARRVVFTSAQRNKKAVIHKFDSFSSRLFTRLRLRQDFGEAFFQTGTSMQHASFTNTPQVDADGDGIPNEEEDRLLLKGLYLGDPSRIYAGDTPEFFRWSPPLVLAEGEHSATIEAVITGGGVSATGIVYAPGKFGLGSFESWESLEGETLELVGDENSGYRATYDGFIQPGTYTVFLYAENVDGPAIPAMTTVTVPGGSSTVSWDPNGDGLIDVLDLVAVGSQFGKSGGELSADVNGDNIVDVLDLVIVGSHFGETVTAVAAPCRQVDLSHIQRASDALRQISLRDPHALLAHQQLAAWLGNQVQETHLLSNYPNPFNPETWFPYQLRQTAHVALEIYDIAGHLIRRLELGHQTAGLHVDRASAAHWDGRNERGELVASGIYFYQLQTGDFVQTRRMTVLR